MKKLLLVLATAVLLFTGCQQETPQSLSFTDIINQATESEVDLSGISCTEDVTVTKAVKIKNADFAGKTLTVKVSGVSLENAKNVNIVVAESVGDGDFTVSGSEAASLKVLGGGANSIHVKDTALSLITIAKTNVRVALEGNTAVAKLQLQKGITAKIEVNSSDVKVTAAEVVNTDGSKVDGESVSITVADGVTFTAPAGITVLNPKNEEDAPTTPDSDIDGSITEFTLSYDSSKIYVCKIEDGKDPELLNNGDKVNKGISLIINAATKPTAGKVIDIVISDKTYYSNLVGIKSLDSSYANGSKIEISYTERDITDITVNLNSSKINCKNYENGSYSIITSGESVNEGADIMCTVVLEDEMVVDKWIINGESFDSTGKMDYVGGYNNGIAYMGMDYICITLRKSMGSSVTVDYTTRAKKSFTINFENNITCTKMGMDYSEIPLTSGSTVLEGDTLNFTYTPAAGKVADKWKVNGVESTNNNIDKNSFRLSRITLDYVSNGQINIEVIERDAKLYTLTFEGNIYCQKLIDEIVKNHNSGDTVLEGTTLWFYANVTDGKTFKSWLVNGKELSNRDRENSLYGVLAGPEVFETESTDITISFTEE